MRGWFGLTFACEARKRLNLVPSLMTIFTKKMKCVILEKQPSYSPKPLKKLLKLLKTLNSETNN